MSDKEAKHGEEELDVGDKPRKGKKSLILIVGAVLLLGIPAGLYFSGVFSKLPTKAAKEKASKEAKKGEGAEEKADTSKAAFIELEEFLVNLNNGNSRQPSFLKMNITLEVEDQETRTKVLALMPRVRDSLQVYLRELRPDELEGSSGLYHLREELLLRVNKVLYPMKVKNILFRDIQTR